jgi:hypothetical protein
VVDRYEVAFEQIGVDIDCGFVRKVVVMYHCAFLAPVCVQHLPEGPMQSKHFSEGREKVRPGGAAGPPAGRARLSGFMAWRRLFVRKSAGGGFHPARQFPPLRWSSKNRTLKLAA